VRNLRGDHPQASGPEVRARPDQKLCLQSWSTEGARVKPRRFLAGAGKLGGQAPQRDRLCRVNFAPTVIRTVSRRKGTHALVTTGGSQKPRHSLSWSRQEALGPRGVEQVRVEPGLDTRNRALRGRPRGRPQAGLTASRRQTKVCPGGLSSPTDRHHSLTRGHQRPSGARRWRAFLRKNSELLRKLFTMTASGARPYPRVESVAEWRGPPPSSEDICSTTSVALQEGGSRPHSRLLAEAQASTEAPFTVRCVRVRIEPGALPITRLRCHRLTSAAEPRGEAPRSRANRVFTRPL